MQANIYVFYLINISLRASSLNILKWIIFVLFIPEGAASLFFSCNEITLEEGDLIAEPPPHFQKPHFKWGFWKWGGG